MTEILLSGDDAGVRTLTLNRPERRNALSPDLVKALIKALNQADDDPSVRAIVLTGAASSRTSAVRRRNRSPRTAGDSPRAPAPTTRGRDRA